MSAATAQAALPSGVVSQSEIRHDVQATVRAAGIALFLAVGSLLAVYLDARHNIKPWPPKGIYLDNYSAVMVTVTLLMGASTAMWAARSAQSGDRGVLAGLFMTSAFGVAVLNAFGFMFNRLGFGVGAHTYGTLVYAMYSVMVVAIGAATVVSFMSAIRAMNEQVGIAYQQRIKATSSFWNVVVIAWLVMFAVVYLAK